MKAVESLLRIFVDVHPEDAARAFETLEPDQRVRLLKSLPISVANSLLERVSPHTAALLLAKLDSDRVGVLLQEMPLRSASSILHQIPEPGREEVLAGLEGKHAASLRELAQHSGETAGAIMEPRVVALPIDLTVQKAISEIRKAPRDALHYLYVTERNGKLTGVINMRDLLLAASRDAIAPLVRQNVVTVRDTASRAEVVELMREKGFLALPVVDFEGRLVGVIRHAEALQAGRESGFDDLQKIVGAGADERALSPVRQVVRSRLPWLYVNLLTAFMAATVIGVFEGIIAQVAALAVLLPVVAGQGGNAGSQSLAVIMRGLALREVLPGVKKRVIIKELLAGLVNGVAVAVVTAAVVWGWRLAAGDSLVSGLGLATVIGLAMIVNMVAAAASGAAIPIILKALGRDPAQSAAIFLTTVTDIVGFAAFLGFATLFMPVMMQ